MKPGRNEPARRWLTRRFDQGTPNCDAAASGGVEGPWSRCYHGPHGRQHHGPPRVARRAGCERCGPAQENGFSVILIILNDATLISGRLGEPNYQVACACFSPVNLDGHVADAVGSYAKPLLQHQDQDYNATFSREGRWIVFTSTAWRFRSTSNPTNRPPEPRVYGPVRAGFATEKSLARQSAALSFWPRAS
jgi:hypothetical protein